MFNDQRLRHERGNRDMSRHWSKDRRINARTSGQDYVVAQIAYCIDRLHQKLRHVECCAESQIDGLVVRQVAHGIRQLLAWMHNTHFGTQRQHVAEWGSSRRLEQRRARIDVRHLGWLDASVGTAQLRPHRAQHDMHGFDEVGDMGAEAVDDVHGPGHCRGLPAAE